MATSDAVLPVPVRRQQTRIVGLVSIGHGFSHYYMLVLPPLFPLIRGDLDIAWAALGALVAVYSIATAVAQIPAGLLVDRFGARQVLIGGFALQAVAIGLIGLAPSYWPIMGLMLLAGIGNAVFHPADYAILSARIAKERHGRAFGIHLLAGYIGWTLAPVTMLSVASLWDWRAAVLVAGLAGLVHTAAMLWLRADLDAESAADRTARAKQQEEVSTRERIKLFATFPIFMLFLFYVLISLAGMGIQTFAVVALMTLYDASLAAANTALTGFFVAGALGVLLGGYFADRTERHDLLTMVCFILAAACIAAIGLGGFRIEGAIVLLFVGGLFLAFVSPSRDIMVRNASPPGAIGTVFGVVSTGFSIGLAVAPVLFGWINDIGQPALVFYLSAAITLLSIVTVLGVRRHAVRSAPAGRSA